MTAWNELFDETRPAFDQQRTFARAKWLAVAGLACLGRHTLSGMLCTAGQQFVDWSATYRLFEQERFRVDQLWRTCLRTTVAALPAKAPIVALMDDTLIHKRGRHVAGASWHRDPLGPRFSTNLVWSSRFLQVSLALPASASALRCSARAIPIALCHAPTPKKPTLIKDKQKYEAALKQWNKQKAAAAISKLGVQHLKSLRQALDQLPGGTQRALIACVDATFTNRTALRQLPARTTLIGRIRKDAKLYSLPTSQPLRKDRGRRRLYGKTVPTPQQHLSDDSIPWQTVRAFAAGKVYEFDVKHILPVRWKASGQRVLSLLVVRPVRYFLRRGSRSSRQPAYLICTDPTLSAEQILQAYLWRWEIELNFRDEKTLIGLGQAQVRTKAALNTAAAFLVFAYALLLLATARVALLHSSLPPPAWRRRPHPNRPTTRVTTPQMLSLFRAQLWANVLGLPNKNGFVAQRPIATNQLQTLNCLQSAVLYATG